MGFERFAAAAGIAAAVAAPSAGAAMMHPHLGARLAGMGGHGVVDLTSQELQGRLCWRFGLHTMHVTRASIRDAHGMKVVELGMRYRPTGCEHVGRRTLRLLEAKPRAYRVWVDTKGHPGELRGTLFAGKARM